MPTVLRALALACSLAAPLGATSCDDKPAEAAELTLETGLTISVDGLNGVRLRKGTEALTSLPCDTVGMNNSTAGSAGDLAWASGELKLACEHADGKIESDLTYDCGSADRPSNKKPKG